RTEGQAYDYSQPCWIGIDTTGTVDGLEANTMHYFVVRAYVADQESADSNEIKFITADCLGTTDSDSDGILDSCDNCILAANADQRDTDGDGFGNFCDTDLDNNGITSASDIAIFRNVIGTNDPDADFDGTELQVHRTLPYSDPS
ncbi:fibronectin type III domain-containing protein, partial [Desulfosarcina sp.]|uniref:fibronectin type III domain-containing protein n=1 Tax=Desulfosarcina sp. TaxID=2027861 RepID=UPI0029B14FDA